MYEGGVSAMSKRIKKPTGSGVFYKKKISLPSTSRTNSFSAIILVKSLSCCMFWLLISINLFFYHYVKNGGGKDDAATDAMNNNEKRTVHASKTSQMLRKVESKNEEDESTSLRRNPPPFKYCRVEEEREYEKVVSSTTSTTIYPFCDFASSDTTNEPIGIDGFQVVSRKVKVVEFNIENNELLSDLVSGTTADRKNTISPPRILCIVYSTSSSPDQVQAITTIKQTWGPKCDGFLVAAETNSDDAFIRIPDRTNEWDKATMLWQSIYTTYLDLYDFFFLSSVDTYLIVENLRFFVASQGKASLAGGWNWPKPLYLGRRREEKSTENKQKRYTPGPQSAYVINQATLRQLVERGLQGEVCLPQVFRQKKTHSEAVDGCLRRLSILLLDSRDLLLAHRFHSFTPQQHASETYLDLVIERANNYDGRILCGHPPIPACPIGHDSISEQSITFGHIQPNLMKQLHALLYNLCIPPDLLQLASEVIQYHKTSGKSWARPVYVDFLSLSNHPFMGALDEHGDREFRHDETALRLNPPAFTWEYETTARPNSDMPICYVNWNPETSDYDINTFQRMELGHEGFKLLTEQVLVSNQSQTLATDGNQQHAKVFCAVYTISSNHFRIEPIRQTWGPKCDGFMVASNVTIPSLNIVNIPHWGEENYNGVWQKLRSIWAYIYSMYIDEYDFFYLGGDDYYLIVENLRSYVLSNDIISVAGGPGWPRPLYLGRRVLDRHNLTEVLNHGGPGYCLNRAALKLLVEKAFMKEFCQPYRWKHSEDRFLGECFRGISVEPYNTRDHKFLHRFHIFTPYQIATGTWGGLGKWVHKYVCFDDVLKSCEYGWNKVSQESISFHYVQPHLMKQIHAALHGLCKFKQKQDR